MKNTLAITPEAAKAIDAVEKMNSEWEGVGSAANLISPDEIQKFEEIKRLAEKILVETLLYDDAVENWTTENLNVIWKIAEDFYAFAKEKEGEK